MTIEAMDFADDLSLIDDNGIDTQRLLGKVAGKAEFVFLQFNVDNTKFCAPKPFPPPPKKKTLSMKKI